MSLDSFSWPAKRASIRDDTSKSRQVYSWFGHQRSQFGDEIEWFEYDMGRAYELRSLVWSHQKTLYTLLFECAVSTLKDFGMNEKMLQGDLGMTAVLHTHTRRLDFHPHLHVVVPGGCIQRRRKQWKKLKGHYLFNEFALASVFRGRFLAAVDKAGITSPKTPPKWVVDCEHVGRGLPALQLVTCGKPIM